MKKLDIVNLTFSFVMIVALGIALFFIISLNNQVSVISSAIGTSNEHMNTLQEAINTSNNYAKQNKKVISDLEERVNALASILEMGGGFQNVASGNESEETEAFPYVEIWMDKDYTINRTSEENGQGNLGWVVVYNGEVVLQRNAEGEMSYSYFGTDKGAYVIYMTDFVDGQYRVISNVIAYNIE